MSEDLTTADEGQQPEPAAETAVFEETDVCYEIQAACSALDTLSELDTAIMTKEDDKRKKRIIRKSLAIIDAHISYLYDCLFDDGKEDKDD